ncbi:hypothetical protein [Nocardia sp.]|uniref:hypothetical protein n=1 Tax=Nocardia sp. TaxID=1821 RepID=UPI00260BF803|nr:hypothetical protein [Nocardia sp.]
MILPPFIPPRFAAAVLPFHSVVLTSLGVNPQVTIMAMALRAADAIGAGLR